MNNRNDMGTPADDKAALLCKEKYLKDQTNENLFVFLNALYGSRVIFQYENMLAKDGEGRNYMLVFTHESQIPEDCAHYPKENATILQCIDLAEKIENLEGIIIDAWTELFLLTMEMGAAMKLFADREK